MRVRGSRKAGMFRKPKEISEYDRPIEDWESPDDEGRFGRAKDECGTMKDELKERRKPEEGVRGRQEGAGQVWNESRNVSENKRDASI
jgi:hypothetical protein